MGKFFAGVGATLVVLVVVAYVYVMTPPWIRKDVADRVAIAVGWQVVEKSDCAEIVEVKVHKKSTFSTWPPGIIFPVYDNQVVLQDGRTRRFNSFSIYRVGWTHCVFWTEYIK